MQLFILFICLFIYLFIYLFHLVHDTARQQHRWTISEAVNTVKCSWWWAKTSPETCRADWVQINKQKICILLIISYEVYQRVLIHTWLLLLLWLVPVLTFHCRPWYTVRPFYSSRAFGVSALYGLNSSCAADLGALYVYEALKVTVNLQSFLSWQ
jgi:hypothetical protein